MRLFLGIISLALITGCSQADRPLLERIKQRGELVVVTRNSPTTYYLGPDGKQGLEYELASRFAARLGVELRLVVVDNFHEIIPMVAAGEADLAAAGLTVTQARKQQVRFGPVYQKITPQVVYRRGETRPRSVEDLQHSNIQVVAGSSHAERLVSLTQRNPGLSWSESRNLSSEELMYRVWQHEIDYTVADSNDVAINRRYYPELRVAFDLDDPQSLAWALPPGGDESLYEATVEFFDQLKASGKLAQLRERYYGHVEDFDYVGTRRYLRHIEQRLPTYEKTFRKAADKHDLDWRLLAAIGYQESHWRPRAESPTGVRGLMMLTLPTAKQLDVDNRLDPTQSIYGGAKYFTVVKKKIPERIPEPDRTWMALASYNVGFGHLEDARKLTEGRGGDPDKWVDVKENLPLLSQRKWYKRTRFGYARGREPVRYVENIRSYYDLLVWESEQRKQREPTPETDETVAMEEPAQGDM